MASAKSDLAPTDEEELLLIVSGMGEHIVAEGRYMIGPECKDCVSDLQRYLRRDDPMVMAAHRALGQWRVLQTHLLPLLQANGGADPKLAFNVLKVIVKLTMKPEQLANRMQEHLQEKKMPDPLVGARIDDLERHHRAYKHAFVYGDAAGMLVSLLGHALGSQRHIKPPLRVLSAASSVSGYLRSACPRQVSTHLWIWIPRRWKPVRPARRALRKHTIYPVLGVARAKAAMQHLESLLSLHNKVDRCRRRRALVLQRLLVLKRHGEHLAVRVRARLDGAAAATMMMAAHPKRNGRDGDDNSNQPGCRGYDGDGNRAGQHQQRRGRRRVGSRVELTFHGHGSHASASETLSKEVV